MTKHDPLQAPERGVYGPEHLPVKLAGRPLLSELA